MKTDYIKRAIVFELMKLINYTKENGLSELPILNNGQLPNYYLCHACECNHWYWARAYIDQWMQDRGDGYMALRSVIGDDESGNRLSDEQYQQKRIEWIEQQIDELTRS